MNGEVITGDEVVASCSGGMTIAIRWKTRIAVTTRRFDCGQSVDANGVDDRVDDRVDDCVDDCVDVVSILLSIGEIVES